MVPSAHCVVHAIAQHHRAGSCVLPSLLPLFTLPIVVLGSVGQLSSSLSRTRAVGYSSPFPDWWENY